LHITSLAGKFVIGDLGPQAYKFAEFLARAKQRVWEILPLNPPAGPRYSPYNSFSAFAGNTALISPEILYREGLLTKSEIADCPKFAKTRVEFAKVVAFKSKLLKTAYKRCKKTQKYEQFCAEHSEWLEDYAIFTALREHFKDKLWCKWPKQLRDRHLDALVFAWAELWESSEQEKFLQYLFFEQWFNLKRYCNKLGIEIIGDLPIYVAYQSADVWSHPEIFKLDRDKRPTCVSGVPPDYFSKTGQLWGNPIYNWRELRKTRYKWWFERIGHNLTLFDRTRIDHFRGFFGFWQVPAGDKTAKNGKWVKGPGKEFFDILFKRFSKKTIIAEDLGLITNDVKSYVKNAGLPGMRVLQFGFDGNTKENPHFPKNHIKNSICYTGTHDNNTTVAWFNKEINEKQKALLFKCLGRKPKAANIHWDMIRLALTSKADLVIIPVQDVLGLGGEARMNRPARAMGNWLWRMQAGKLTPQIARKLATLTKTSGR
jgi:4-alpha-glucanotransferase